MSVADTWKVQMMSGPAYTTPTHVVVRTNGWSAVALAANASRRYALFVNDSDTTMYLALGVAAAVNTGIRLNAAGGSFEMSELAGNLYLGAVSVYCADGKSLLVTEGV